ncbi:MAG: carbohydrate ABC transporter permease [Fimbriimonadaceae bacterium]|nr:carbohydrate ABC transporter permease [Fimbriimonadaceae bacterium]
MKFDRHSAGASALLIIGSFLFMLPMYLMLVMSLKTKAEIAVTSPWAWPSAPTLDNYRILLTDTDFAFWRKLGNTLFLSVAPTIGVTLTAAMVAYPFARLQFRGRDRLFLVLLSTMMLPGVVTMIPGYMINAALGWIDTYYPFVVPAFFGGGAFNIFLLRQFFLSIPREMDEAAKIDGASLSLIFWRMILPNSGPVLATVAVFTFVGSFRDFMGPLMILNDPYKQTLEVGLRGLQTARDTEWNLLMAGSMLVMLPIVIVFLSCQRYFVQGISLTGGK